MLLHTSSTRAERRLISDLSHEHPLIIYLKKCTTKNRGTASTVNAAAGASRAEIPAFDNRDSAIWSPESKEPESYKVAVTSQKRGLPSNMVCPQACDSRQGFWRTSQATSGPGALSKEQGFRYSELFANEQGGVSDSKGRVVCAVYGDQSARDWRFKLCIRPVDAYTEGCVWAPADHEMLPFLKSRAESVHNDGSFFVMCAVDFEDIFLTMLENPGPSATSDEGAMRGYMNMCLESMELSCYAPEACRGILDTPRAIFTVLFDPRVHAGHISVQSYAQAARRVAEEFRVTRLAPGDPSGPVAMYCCFQNLTQKVLDSKHDSKGQDSMREIRNNCGGRAGRAHISFEVHGQAGPELEARVARAVAWITVAPVHRVAVVRVAQPTTGDPVGCALYNEYGPDVWVVDIGLNTGGGWTAALMEEAIRPFMDKNRKKRTPKHTVVLHHASQWGVGPRRARVLLLYDSEEKANTCAAALEVYTLGFAKDVVCEQIAPGRTLVSGWASGVKRDKKTPGPVASVIEAPKSIGINTASIKTTDPWDALRHFGEFAFRNIVSENMSAVFEHSVDYIHFGLVVDFMTVDGPWLHPGRRRGDHFPLVGHAAVKTDGGPLVQLFYKFVRKNIRRAFTTPSKVDVRN